MRLFSYGREKEAQETPTSPPKLARPPKVYDILRGRRKAATPQDFVSVSVVETGSWTPSANSLPDSSIPQSPDLESGNTSSSENTTAAKEEPSDMVAKKAPWWKRYSGYRPLSVLPPSRTRRAIILGAIAGALLTIALLVWAAKTGRFDRKEPVALALAQGTYMGEITPSSGIYPRGIEAWRGIPYAQSTAGENRFRPPQALSNAGTATTFDARNFGTICSQGASSGGEDCLNLNLYRPHYGNGSDAEAKDMAKLGGTGKSLPIVIYVHGGAFNSGRGMERNMASFVSWAETPIIGISFNYRVGALGFLPSSVAQKAGLLNLGLKDQQMLFVWVQKNAASFGGDPDNVTLMGLSAGSHSIGHQLISYAPANKLTSDPAPFHKIITESGAPTARSVLAPTHPLHEQQFQEFLGQCGLSGIADDQVFDQLRALPWSKIQAASYFVYQKYNKSIRWPFQPTIDGPGGVVPDLPLQSWEKGNVLRIPVLAGFDTNEGTIFVPTGDSDSAALRRLMGGIVPALNETSLETMETIYPDPNNTTEGRDWYITKPPAGFGKQFWRLDDAYAHYAYICPVLQTGHYMSTLNQSTVDYPVYIYQFAARSQAHGGADHGDEAVVVAHDMQVLNSHPGLAEAADAMTGYWSRFAAYGNPNPTSYTTAAANVTLTWPPFRTPFLASVGQGADSTAGGRGGIALFADGNNERMMARGPGSPGTPVQMRTLEDRVVMECRFWIDRVVYSEGYGNGTLTV